MRLERTDEMKKAQSIPRRSPGDRSPGNRSPGCRTRTKHRMEPDGRSPPMQFELPLLGVDESPAPAIPPSRPRSSPGPTTRRSGRPSRAARHQGLTPRAAGPGRAITGRAITATGRSSSRWCRRQPPWRRPRRETSPSSSTAPAAWAAGRSWRPGDSPCDRHSTQTGRPLSAPIPPPCSRPIRAGADSQGGPGDGPDPHPPARTSRSVDRPAASPPVRPAGPSPRRGLRR